MDIVKILGNLQNESDEVKEMKKEFNNRDSVSISQALLWSICEHKGISGNHQDLQGAGFILMREYFKNEDFAMKVRGLASEILRIFPNHKHDD